MKKIVDITDSKEVLVTTRDLPMLIHAKEHSGGSLFAISVAAMLHEQGAKLLIFTAYPMAKDEFLSQISDVNTVLLLEGVQDLARAGKFQSIIVQSGNENLLLKVLEELPNLAEYVPFIKNIETITEPDILEYALSRESVIAGDAERGILSGVVLQASYATRVLFGSLAGMEDLNLQKYQAKMFMKGEEHIVSIH